MLWALWLCLFSSSSSLVSLGAPPEEALLLRSLGGLLGRRATPGPRSSVPPLLWEMFRRRTRPSEEEGGDQEPPRPCWVEEFGVPGNIVRVFEDQGPPFGAEEPRDGDSVRLRKPLRFDLAALDAAETLTLARLELRLRQNWYQAALAGPEFEVRLYENGDALLSRSSARFGQRLAFDLTLRAQKWRRIPDPGLALEIAAPFSRKFRAEFEASLVAVSLAPGRRCKSPPRPKRGVPARRPPPGGHVCKARRLYVSFAEVGWEHWIIAPAGYLANYCHGECPFPLAEALNGTNHAVLQTVVHSLEPGATPPPCCVPVRLSPVSILYYDNRDNVVLRHYEDMAVDECGCR